MIPLTFYSRPRHSPGIRELLSLLFCFFKAMLSGRCNVALENLALRQQLAILKRTQKRPAISTKDRLFWSWLSRSWSGWRAPLLIVKPETVIGWHRKGFRLFWTKLSRRNIGGRPSADSQIKALIKQMTQANPLWGAPRIHGELLKLGIDISGRSVSRLMPKGRKPPSQTWRTFLDNHFRESVSIDFLTVPTATFRVLYVFIVLAHDRRRVLHFDVTEHPTAAWTAQRIIETFPDETAPRFLLRDRDRIYIVDFCPFAKRTPGSPNRHAFLPYLYLASHARLRPALILEVQRLFFRLFPPRNTHKHNPA